MPRIQIIEPNHVYTFELPVVPGAEVLIGTAPHCQLSLPGVGGLGEVHARISCQPQGYVISDLGSPYGTLANGVPFHSDYLMLGVEYRMGAACITLLPDAAAMPQQPLPPQQPVAAPAPAPAPAAAGTVKKTVVRKKTVSTAQAAGDKKAASASANNVDRFNRNKGSKTALFNLIYVVVLLLAAVYAGIALRHWQATGNFLPGITSDAAK